MIDATLLQRLSELTEEEKAILRGQSKIDRTLYMDGSRDVISGDKLLKPGQMLTVRPHTRFIRFPRHTHDYVEMVYMCRGTTLHIVDGAPIRLSEGELLILAQNAVQEIEPAGENDVAVNFIVRPEFFSGVLPFLGAEDTPLKRFLIDCLCGRSEVHYLHFCVSEALPIRNLIENLMDSAVSPSGDKRAIQRTTMGLLFMELVNHTETLHVDSSEQSAVVTVLRAIEERYRSGSLSALANDLHYDLHALSRLIKQKTGHTYTELLQEKRLKQAGWLLRNTDKNVDEIARSVGYENISYFHRLFASVYGCSPKKYRAANQDTFSDNA